MRTLKLTVSEKAYEKLIVIFSLFGEKDLQVADDADFLEHQKHLEKQLAKIKSGKSNLISSEEAERQIDELLAEHESHV